jgi:hypothetical protein
MDIDVSHAVMRNVVMVGRTAEFNSGASVDGPGGPVCRKGDLVNETDPFWIIGTKRYYGPGIGVGASNQPHAADRCIGFLLNLRASDQREGVLIRFGRNGKAIAKMKSLDRRLRARRKQETSVFSQNPAIDGPAVEKGCNQTPRIHDRQFRTVGQSDCRPVAMCKIDMGDGESPRNKGVVLGVELALDPVRPDPVQVLLYDPAVDEAPGMKHHACTEQLYRLGNLGRLGKPVETSQQGDRVKEPVGPSHTTNNEFPGQPLQPHRLSPQNSSKLKAQSTEG